MRCALSILTITIAVISTAAQAPPPKLAFEVASIKQAVFENDAFWQGYSAGAGACGKTRLSISGKRVTLLQVSICGLISMAYDFRGDLITGVPDWMKKNDRSVFFEIQAIAVEEPEKLTPERAREMLQSLLADRFHLKVHRETKDMKGYALVVGKNGPKLSLSPHGPCEKHPDASSIFGMGQLVSCKPVMTMAEFAERLSRIVDQPVLDKTDIPGGQAFELYWNAGGAIDAPPNFGTLPSLLTALQEQLGLKLEASRGPVEVLVIDSVALPSVNRISGTDTETIWCAIQVAE